MKDINELVEELAKLYGIEIIDKPNSHVVELEDGTRRPLEEEDFYEVFGLNRLANNLKNKLDNMSQEEECLKKIKQNKTQPMKQENKKIIATLEVLEKLISNAYIKSTTKHEFKGNIVDIINKFKQQLQKNT